VNVPKVKEFLEAMKALGSIRIILNNGVAVRAHRRPGVAVRTALTPGAPCHLPRRCLSR
jgi:hypothetical protein